MKRILLILAALLAFASCNPAKDPAENGPADNPQQDAGTRPGEYVLPVIETTDIHGYIINTGNNVVHYRMAYVADKVKDIRGRGENYSKDRLLLLDGGDLYQGASVSNMLSGMPIYMSMDLMDYDAVALGNHEFDWGFDNMVDPDATLLDFEWSGSSYVNEIPVLCANLYQDGKRVSTTQDYCLLEKTAVGTDGATVKVKVGVIGFAVDYSGSIMTSKFIGSGYSIREDYSIANRIASELESSGQCDATVLLIHGAGDRAAECLGESSVIDFVLGGHSHRTLSGRTGWGLPYLQGGRYCEHYASAEMKFSVNKEGKVRFIGVSKMSINPVDANRDRRERAGQNAQDLEDDVVAVSDDALSATARLRDEVIGYITVGATKYYLSGGGDRSATVSNWMCDILRRIGEADVAFVNSGGIRTVLPLNGQSRRDVTIADVYELFPFDNATYVYRITYADLVKLLEYSMTSAGKELFSRIIGIDCYYTQSQEYESPSGGKYREYFLQSVRKDGTLIYNNGKWTGDWASRTLLLAVSEYLATTQRDDYYRGLSNPLPEWNKTSRLLFNDLIDNMNAVRVLREEASASGGHLYIDTRPHFILAGER